MSKHLKCLQLREMLGYSSSEVDTACYRSKTDQLLLGASECVSRRQMKSTTLEASSDRQCVGYAGRRDVVSLFGGAFFAGDFWVQASPRRRLCLSGQVLASVD